MFVFATIVGGIVLLYFIFVYVSTPSNLPPGPRGLPLVGFIPGYLSFAPTDFCNVFMKLGKIYGPVFPFYQGSKLTVVLNEYGPIREAFVDKKKTFAGRDAYRGMLNFAFNESQLFQRDYDSGYKPLHKCVLSVMKGFGLESDARQTTIQTHMEAINDGLRRTMGQPFLVKDVFRLQLVSMFTSMAFGNSFAQNENRTLLNTLETWMQLLGEFANQPDILAKISTLWPPYRKKMFLAQCCVNIVTDVFRREIEAHRISYEARSPQTIVDLLLLSGHDDAFILDVICSAVLDVVFTIDYVMSQLVEHITDDSRLQLMIQQEIDEVIPSDQPPRLSDKAKLPLLTAAFWESVRCTPAVNTIKYKALEDTTISDFCIPKDTLVISNLYNALRDEQIWSDPETFRPGRYIAKDGSLMKRPGPLIIFGAGERRCPGQYYAEDVIIRIAAHFLKHFKLSKSGNEPTQDYKLGGDSGTRFVAVERELKTE